MELVNKNTGRFKVGVALSFRGSLPDSDMLIKQGFSPLLSIRALRV